MPDAYGQAVWPVLKANLLDRLQGQSHRARARMGRISAPGQKGRVVWLKAGATPTSVRLAAELTGALREKRLDIQLVMTFEQEYAREIAPRVQGLRRFGLGYGPCDQPAVVQRVLDRLKPLGVILVDTVQGPELLRQSALGGIPVIAYNTPPLGFEVTTACPRDAAQHASWQESGQAQQLLSAADPTTLWVESHTQATLRSMLPAHTAVFWWHGPQSHWPMFHRSWQASSLSDDSVLFVSLSGRGEWALDETVAQSFEHGLQRWDRHSFAKGQIIHMDHARWLPAVVSAAWAAHLIHPGQALMWQALAGSLALSDESTPEAVLADWQESVQAPMQRQQRADANRRRFWEERRHAREVVDVVLQQVFDW
ncbi:glycosyltransferase N-terminal domain-containing protein [Ectothiorhodosinus mongolicus]|nr:glycosyltransferase N-terminal domain-containing protein [Ectothiorhodosinus mongolicus]